MARNKNKIENIGVADSETDPFKYGRVPKPFLWGFYINGCYYEFEKTIDFINFVREEEFIIYAHNGGKFDWHFVLNESKIAPDIKIISGRISEFKIGKCTFRDSINILPIPLDAYKKDEIDYNIFTESERKKSKNWKAIRDYLKADCIYLYELVIQFIEDYGINLTLAGAALKFFNKLCDYKTPRTNLNYFDDMNRFYYGGRVQVFKAGVFENVDYKYIDLNSAYPAEMCKRHPYGTKRSKSSKLPKVKDNKIFITLKCRSNGHFPLRNEKGGLDFPDDNEFYTFSITGWEYYAALEYGIIKDAEIIEVISYLEEINFTPYVNHFYKLKENATLQKDAARRLFAKLFMNSLYGKYATNPKKYKQYSIQHPETAENFEIFNKDYKASNEIGENIIYERQLYEDELNFLNVATSASITGAVRAVMMKALLTVENPLYCDTDSIICKSTSDLELDPIKLGAWDVEAEPTFIAIAGKKLYTMKTKNHGTKSASKGAKLTHEQIIKVAKGETVEWKSDAPTFSISRGARFNHRKIQKTV